MSAGIHQAPLPKVHSKGNESSDTHPSTFCNLMFVLRNKNQLKTSCPQHFFCRQKIPPPWPTSRPPVGSTGRRVGPFVPFSLVALGSHSWSKSSQGVERLGQWGGFSEVFRAKKSHVYNTWNMSPSKKNWRGGLEDTWFYRVSCSTKVEKVPGISF